MRLPPRLPSSHLCEVPEVPERVPDSTVPGQQVMSGLGISATSSQVGGRPRSVW